MAFDFPATPALGQVFGNYIWDGEKWKLQGGQALGAVRYDTPQILSAGQQAQARSNIAAPDLSALAYSGMQINGSMEVSQEKGTTVYSFTNTFGYAVDGWMVACFGATGSVNGLQNAFSGQVPGLINFLSVQCGTANPMSGANDAVYVFQPIEGYRWARLGFGSASAQSVTIGFWILAELTGTMAVSLRGGGGRSYVIDVPIATVGWQYKTVIIPGDVAGAWVTNNTSGVSLAFCFGAGSGRKTPANTWIAGDFIASPATTNFFTTVNKSVFISGVVVLPGTQAPTAAQSPLIMRPYDQELLTCQRYYGKDEGLSQFGYQTSAVDTFRRTVVHFKNTMRIAPPTVTVALGVVVPIIANTVTAQSFSVLLNPNNTNTGVYITGWTADARL